MRKPIFFTFFLLFLFILTACDKGQLQNNYKTMPERGVPDFSQPEEKADIMGVVKSVMGNEVTVLKIKRPESNLEDKMETREKDQSANKSVSFSANSSANSRRMPGMGKSGITSDNKDEMIEMIKKMSTGEESVTVPIGIQMLKTEESEKGTPKILEANLNDIKANKMINIWLNKDVSDQRIASFILIK